MRLGKRRGVIGAEHKAERGHDEVEGGVGQVERLGIHHLDAHDSGHTRQPLARHRHHVRCEVHGGHPRTGRAQQFGYGARTAPEVERIEPAYVARQRAHGQMWLAQRGLHDLLIDGGGVIPERAHGSRTHVVAHARCPSQSPAIIAISSAQPVNTWSAPGTMSSATS